MSLMSCDVGRPLRKSRHALCGLMTVIALAACGQKGPLYLPSQQPSPAEFGGGTVMVNHAGRQVSGILAKKPAVSSARSPTPGGSELGSRLLK